MTKSRNINAPRRAWSEGDLEFLRNNYADRPTDEIAAGLQRSVTTTYQKAHALGLFKSEAYLASEAACRLRRGDNVGAEFRFKKGQTSWSKGTKGLVGVQENCRATQFKKGRLASEARNYVPIGTVRLCRDGLLERKVTDDPFIVPARRWVAVHRLVWIEAHGEIPEGHVVVFRPRCRTTVLEEITADRLECITRADLARRNGAPPELRPIVQLRGAITRQINKRLKEEAA